MCRKTLKTCRILCFCVLVIICTGAIGCFAQQAPIPSIRKEFTLDNDKRAFVRVATDGMKYPVSVSCDERELEVIDISRGGVGLKVDNKYKIGDVIPVKVKYRELEIDSNLRVVRKDDNSIGAEFVTDETKSANQLMYMSIRLEADNGKLVTRFSENGIL